MVTSFERLSPRVQRIVYDAGWPALTAIQDAGIAAILGHQGDVILSAETASGKTEAAFLPILSVVGDEIPKSLKVLYLSPLKALINDQNERLTLLLGEMGIEVHRWHGDVSQDAKRKLLKSPRGILQITPESIESLLINHVRDLRLLLKDVQFVVLDEIHAFLGTERGTHLRSLLARVVRYAKPGVRVVGLSATLGDVKTVQEYLHPRSPDEVMVVDGGKSGRGTDYCLMHFDRGRNGSIPLSLLQDVATLTRDMRAIIFVNSKGELEEASVLLNRIAKKEDGAERYLVHHASVSAREREYVEREMRESTTPKSVLATSTLELGIDIGKLDLVAQIDSTFSVSSLKQRLGRSGRRAGMNRTFMLYTTTDEQFLQALAVTELFLEGWVEPPLLPREPWDILWHQLVSIARERSDLNRSQLAAAAIETTAFGAISVEDAEKLIGDMIAADQLEEIPGTREVVPGLEAEHVLGGKDWYAVFATPPEYDVQQGDRSIGTLTRDPSYQPGTTLILAGKLWLIREMDDRKHRIYVEPAPQGQRPKFVSCGGIIAHEVRQKMHDLLYGSRTPKYIRGGANEVLESLRLTNRMLGVRPNARAISVGDGKTHAHLFVGTRIAVTLKHLLDHKGILSRPYPFGHLNCGDAEPKEVAAVLGDISRAPPTAESVVARLDASDLSPTKFGQFLPEWAQRRHFISRFLDVDTAAQFLRTVEIIAK